MNDEIQKQNGLATFHKIGKYTQQNLIYQTTVCPVALCLRSTKVLYWKYISLMSFERCTRLHSLALINLPENLELDNSLKWVPFNVVSGQITSNALWK